MRFLPWSRVRMGFAWIAILLVGISASSSAARIVEFWTIEPNEGQSAGGHSAIRIDDWIYHVEHRGDGLIVDRRDVRRSFDRVYRQIGNRSIDVLELDLPKRAADELDSILRRRYFERHIRLERLADLEEDLAWLDRALVHHALEVAVPGLGLLATDESDCLAPEAIPRAERKAEILASHGRFWLEERIASMRQRLNRALAEATGASGMKGVDSALDAAPVAGRVRRVIEIAQMIHSLEAIRRCRSPAQERLVPLVADGPARRGPSSDQARAPKAAWLAMEVELEARIERLLSSDRLDSGLAILLAWTRLAALDRSVATGVTTVVDSIAEAVGEGARGRQTAVPTEWRVAHEAESRATLANRIRALGLSSGVDIEARIFHIEIARHALTHAESGEIHLEPEAGSFLRVTGAMRHPTKLVHLPWPAGLTIRELKANRDGVAARVRRERRRLESDLGYSLISRNCVTELLDALDEALLKDPATAAFQAKRRRDAESFLSFIPVVAARIARRSLPVKGIRNELSGRAALLHEERVAGGGTLLDRLRESNTLSSRSYPANSRDSVFLFFTVRPVLLRPMLGIANVVTGIGATAVGLVRAPVDHAELLKRGLNGILMSIPELFFFNIRKGTYVVPPPLVASPDRGT